jgi:serine/threonine protein phosphatase PrpC
MSTARRAATAAAVGFTWRSAAVTTRGNVRAHNEDAVLDLSEVGLWLVADGMGGHKAGDVASNAIVAALSSLRRHARPSVLLDEIEDRLAAVNEQLYRASFGEGAGVSGSTVAVLIALERHVLSLWAGDSRIYRCRAGHLAQLTRDHSETQEQVDEGVLSAEAAETRELSNVITRAVGGASELFLDLELTELQHDDRFLLCSDGLYREVPKGDLLKHLSGAEPLAMCDGLIRQALTGSCRDNVSAVVVRFSAP